MDFNKLLLQAKDGEPETVSELLEIYKPLLTKNSIINGTFDEDLYQKLCITFLRCIHSSVYKI